jgi:hypothetical protein
MVMQPSWSLHLLSEILAAFSTEDPENLRNVVNRVAESVEAEVAAILSDGTIRFCIGMTGDERQQLESLASSRPPQITIGAGRLNTYWAPLGEGNLLVVGRLGDTFDVEERSLLRAMARSIELSRGCSKPSPLSGRPGSMPLTRPAMTRSPICRTGCWCWNASAAGPSSLQTMALAAPLFCSSTSTASSG